MALPYPVLDDRSYEQLLAELRARIPVYTPLWTDLGESDPGITLLELVAHLGESLLYRFNQIPDQTRLWLLRLLQVTPYPPQRATGLVTFGLEGGPGAPPALVPLGTTVTAGAVPFRTGNDIAVVPAAVTAVTKSRADEPTDPVLLEEYRQLLDLADVDPSAAAPYTEAVLRRDAGQPGLEELDVRPAVDRCLWVAVQAPDGAPGTTDEQRTALLDPHGPLALNPLVLGFAVVAEDPAGGAVVLPAQTAGASAPGGITAVAGSGTTGPDSATGAMDVGIGPQQLVPGAERPGAVDDPVDSSLIWQVSTVSGEYPQLSVVRDTTSGLAASGVVALQLPPARFADLGVPPLDEADLGGIGDTPPRLEGRPPALFWLRAFPREGVPEIGRLAWVGVNAADVEQVAQAPLELLGTGQGISHQELALANGAVVAGSLQVEVREDDVWQPWTVVESLAAGGPGDRHLSLDAAAGRVQCGDGVRGRVLPAGAPVRAVGYRYGGGTRGNVAPKAISGVLDVDGVRVENPVPTTGGEEGESISRALERIPGELSRQNRAVVADDFRALALIPGVGRAECLPHFDPATRDTDAAGVVTVMVWPTRDPRHPDAPTADSTLLRAVFEQLDPRRLVTTELYVVPPVYRPVAVSVGIAVKPGYSAIGVRRWVDLVLHQYLSPLPPFGPEGAGWPLGRRVHGPELEAAVLQVEGVDYVEGLLVADVSGSAPVEGTVELAGWEAPALSALGVVVGPPPPAGTGTPQPIGPSGPAPVPVPVPRDEC
jgi:hypothetical protein